MTEETIFATALKKGTAAERQAYLEEACAGQPELKAQVEQLLRASAGAESFLEKPAPELAPTITGRTKGDTDDEERGGVSLACLEPCDVPGRIGKIGAYEVIEVVGRGGMGAVLRAMDVKLNRVVAVKVMSPELSANPMAVKRFLREAQTAAAVVHDHVVTIHAVDDSGKVPFLVMEFISGQSLQDKIDRVGALRLAEILRIGMQAASGLAAAHKQGLIHRDVKPANILLENGVERVKITDFGLARATDDLNITKSGQICGTPQYMSPEQAQGHQVDHRTDLFSLGSVLYTLATGRPAFRADSTVAILRRVCDDVPRPIGEINPEIPDWLAAIIEKLMAKKPEDRFQTAAEVADLLARHLAHIQQPDMVPRPAVSLGGVAAPAQPSKWPWLGFSVAILWGVTVVGILILALVSEFGIVRGHTLGVIAVAGFTACVTFTFLLIGAWWVRQQRAFERGGAAGAGSRGEVSIPGRASHAARKVSPPPKQAVPTRSSVWVLVVVLLFVGVIPVLFVGLVAGWFLLSHSTSPKLSPPDIRSSESSHASGFVMVPAADVTAESDEGAWVPLFNSQDLTGWKTRPEQPGNWRVEKGILTASGARSHLFTERGDFEDFVLRLEARISAGGNSGVLLRCEDGFDFDLNRVGGTGRVPRGLEVDFHAGTQPEAAGSLWHLGNAQWLQSAARQRVRPDEWFTMEVRVEETRVQVSINGEELLNHSNMGVAQEFKRGHIALQWLDERGRVEFRKIEIRELNRPSSEQAPAAAIAPFDAEQAKQHQEAWAKYLGVRVEYTNTIGMKFRLIPPGEFQRGSAPEEIEAALKQFASDPNWQEFAKSEGPRHKVTLTQPIYLGIHEVTQQQFRDVMGTNPSHFSAGGEGKDAVAGIETGVFPVESVSWNEAAEFCVKLSEKERRKAFYFHDRTQDRMTVVPGNGYRLPTEAEWEFACRAGTTTRYWNGDEESGLNRAGWSHNNSGARTHAVGELAANPFGLFDVHGNVWEWVQDGWSASEYAQFGDKAAVDPQGPQATGPGHVIRGGGWDSTAAANRSASRLVPSPRFKDLGFRVALPLDSSRPRPPRKAVPAKAPFTAAQAREYQEAWGEKLDSPVEFENSIGMKLRLIPPGEFQMGCTEKEAADARKEAKLAGVDDKWADFVERSSQPRHRVRLTEPYFMGMHEVTIGQFKKFTAESRYTPTAERESKEKPGEKKEAIWRKFRDEQPVMYISWDDAREFCLWLSAKEQRTYRIPTEAQWEFACRAGTEARWSFGDDVSNLPEYAWSGQGVIAGPKDVGTLKPNPFGLFDMHGNITEWCVDWHKDDFYSRGPVDDPVELTRGNAQGRVHRGGWWSELPSLVRSAARNYHEPDHTGIPFGLRVVLTGGFPKVEEAGKGERGAGN